MASHVQQIELTRRLLLALDCGEFVLNPSDRPDVDAAIGGRSIGVEVTVFHADEGLGRRGSVLRATEEKAAKQAGGDPYLMWGIIDPLPGLITRINDKVTIAEDYDRRRFDELWLLIVGQFPKPGAVGSTFALSAALNAPCLNRHLHELLSKSPFARAYLYLSLEQTIYAWTPSEGWRLLMGSPEAADGSELWFRNVFRDPEWLRDPAAKARAEAQKVLDEFAAQRNKTKEP
jgi:hypothetical protein